MVGPKKENQSNTIEYKNNNFREQWQQGKIILLDRYTTSSLIYQSAFINGCFDKRHK